MAGNWIHISNSPNENHNRIELPKNTVENDLSNLVGMTGVTHTINAQKLDVYELDENTSLVIRGTLYHDPDKEILVLHHNNSGISGSTYNGGEIKKGTASLIVSGGAWYETAYYYYGKEYTDPVTGRTTYSKNCGLMIVGDNNSVWHPTDAGISGGNHNSYFVFRGGVVQLNRMLNLAGAKLDILKTTFVGSEYSRMLEFRNPIGNDASTQLNATFDKIAILEPAKPYPINLDLQGGTIGEVTAGGGAWEENELRNLDLSKNTGPYDIGSDSSGTSHHQDWIIVNSATGTDVRKMWRDTRGNGGQRGVVIIKKEVSLNVKDGNGNAIEGAKIYTKDSPSSTARDTVFLASKSNTSTHPFTKPTLSNADVDSDGNLIYYYADPLEYNFTTDSNGDTATEKITTGVNTHEYNANDSDALSVYAIPDFSGGKWKESDGELPQYTDWDTDRFGGFYKVDRRGNGNTNADEFSFFFCSYGHFLSSNTQALKGLDELKINWVLFTDTFITDSRVDVDDYTAIDTPQKFYNKAKAHLVDNYQGEEQTIVSRDGNIIDAGDFDVVVNANADPVFNVNYSSPVGDSSYSLEWDNFGTQVRITFTPEFEFYDDVKNGVFSSLQSSVDTSTSEFYFEKYFESNSQRYRLSFRMPSGSQTGRLYNIVANGNGTGWQWEILSGSSSTYLGQGWNAYMATTEGVNELQEIVPPQDPSTITIKSSIFTGNIRTTGEVFLTDVNFNGQIEDKNGTRTFGQFNISNLLPGSRVQVYNNTKGATVFNDIVDSNILTRGFSSGEMNDGDEIRIRIAYQNGQVAKEPQEIFTTATSPSWSAVANQVDATEYNNFLLDGSSVSEFALDLSTGGVEVDINDDDNSTTIQRFGSWYYYQLTTADGIKHLFGAVKWVASNQIVIDQSVVDIKLDNRKTQPLLLTGGRMYRLDETSIIGPTSNSIQIDYSPIYITNAPLIESIEKNTKLIPALL